MRKILMTFAALVCCTAIMNAQQSRNQVYNIVLGNVQYAHHNEKVSTGDAVGQIITGVLTGKTSVQATKFEPDVKNAIIKGLSHAHRFRFNNMGETAEPIEGDILVDAVITNINAKSNTDTWKDKNGKTQVNTYYTGVVEVMLTMKDAITGDIIYNPTMKGQSSTSSKSATYDQAVLDACGKLSGQITGWLNRYCPLQANIVEGAAAKKDKQKEVYIDLGSQEGAYAGLHMGVFIVKTVAGREAFSQIGKLKIEAVEGAEISRCKVQSGGKDIKAAIDRGEQLRVTSID
ncbi:MAG: hypothetical protein J5678_00720 [Bacteroidaceae bacterium]|nr:hypothetical protein [Bacteroidaceae bacterium]